MKLLDEVSVFGALVSLFFGSVMATFYPVDPEYGFRGLLFLTFTGIGFLFFVAAGAARVRRRQPGDVNPTPESGWAWRSLFHVNDFVVFVGSVVAGVFLTFLVQRVALMVPNLSSVEATMQGVYLAEAALSETYLYFGLAAFFSERIAWFVGLPIPSIMAFGTHQFVYGTTPNVVLAVVLSFGVQATLYQWNGRLSVPLCIHLIINLLYLVTTLW